MWVLLPAMLLLGMPMDWLLRGEVRFGQVDQMFLRGRKRELSGWNAAMLVLDPVRAAVGAGLLAQGAKIAAVHLGGSFPDATAPLILGIGMFVSMVAQLYTGRDPEYLLAPVGYAAGLIISLVAPSVAAIALLISFATLAGTRAWSGFFFAGAIACAGVGFLLMELDPVTPAVLGAVLFLPAIAGMLMGRHLMMPGR